MSSYDCTFLEERPRPYPRFQHTHISSALVVIAILWFGRVGVATLCVRFADIALGAVLDARMEPRTHDAGHLQGKTKQDFRVEEPR